MAVIVHKIYKLIYYLANSWKFNSFHYTSEIKKAILITPRYIKMGVGARVREYGRIEGVSERYGQYYRPLITIGDHVTIEQNVHITCANRISIGNNTAIAAHVSITDIHHPYTDIDTPIEKQTLEVGEVIIGPDSKIYNGAVILPNVHIGKHVTIGANSVVTHNIPDYSVAVGSPARIIKRYNFETKQWEKTENDGYFLAKDNE